MGKIGDLVRKTEDLKRALHAGMGTVKDRNSKDLTEAKEIKKRRGGQNTQKSVLCILVVCTEELYKKSFNDPDNHDGVVIHPKSDILECEVKWALGSITMNKASGGDGIPVELFKLLKDDAVKVLCSVCQQIWKIQQWP